MYCTLEIFTICC